MQDARNVFIYIMYIRGAGQSDRQNAQKQSMNFVQNTILQNARYGLKMGVAQQGSGTEAAQVLIGGAVGACTLKSESPHKWNESGETRMMRVKRTESGKAENMKKQVCKMVKHGYYIYIAGVAGGYTRSIVTAYKWYRVAAKEAEARKNPPHVEIVDSYTGEIIESTF